MLFGVFTMKAIENALQSLLKKCLNKEYYIIWELNRSNETILEEFNRLNEWRRKIYYVDPTSNELELQEEFKVATDLCFNHHYRDSRYIAFQYNSTDPTYNASTIILNGLRILALEAPSQTSCEKFFNLLYKYRVTHLVRLTPALENGVEKSYPYWSGNIYSDSDKKTNFLKVPIESENDLKPYTVNYIWTDNWEDNQSGDAEELLHLILEARKNFSSNALLAVHCHSGVARTGTFIAGFILLDEIDKQILVGNSTNFLNISVEKIVMQLSLQRFYMVGQPLQYLTLYRLVDLYVNRTV